MPPTLLPGDDDARWDALLARDAGADGRFVYAVRTTGVYCRPSCAARTPRRENVTFHATNEAARAAGFRPCLRCRPDDPPPSERRREAVARACRLIEAEDSPPSLAALAEAAGMSPFHFHRVFREVTGVTPAAFARARRAARLEEALPAARSVTGAI